MSLFSVKEQNCFSSVSLAAVPHPGGDRPISALYQGTRAWAKILVRARQFARGLQAAGMGENPGQVLRGDAKTWKGVMKEGV